MWRWTPRYLLTLLTLVLILLNSPRTRGLSDETCVQADLNPDGSVLSDLPLANLLSEPERRITCCQFLSPYHNSSTGVWLTVFMPLYSSTSTSEVSSIKCTRPRPKLMVQLVEAVRLLFEDTLREKSLLLKYLRGIEVRDTCGLTRAAVEAALHTATQSGDAAKSCHLIFNGGVTAQGQCSDSQRAMTNRIGVVLGPAFSSELEVSSTVLSAYQIPHISYWATSNLFEMKDNYPYLFRTATMDRFAARAILDMLDNYGWGYVNLLHGTSSESLPSIAEDLRVLNSGRENQICIAVDEQFQRNDKEKMMKIARKLIGNSSSVGNFQKPIVTVFIAGYLYVQEFVDVVTELAVKDVTFGDTLNQSHFVWIASDGWLSRAIDIFPALPSCNSSYTKMLGRHSVLGPVFRVPEVFSSGARHFSNRLVGRLGHLNVTARNVMANPYLGVAWQAHSACCLEFLPRNGSCSPCSQNQSVSEVFGAPVSPILSGSFWLSYQAGIEAMKRTLAQNPNILSQNSPGFGRRLGASLLNLTLDVDVSGNRTAKQSKVFTDVQETKPAFSIYSMVFNGCKRTLEEVGSWEQETFSSDTRGRITIDRKKKLLHGTNATLWASSSKEVPKSICSHPCPPGFVSQSGTALADHAGSIGLNIMQCRVCWLCVQCANGTFSLNNTCQTCEKDLVPNKNQTGCVKRQFVHISYSSTLVQVIASAVGLSMAASLFAGVMFFVGRCTEVARQAGVGQSIMILLTINMGFINTYTFFFKPLSSSCTILMIVAVWSLIVSNSLVVGRLLRLVALSEDIRNTPVFMQRLGKLVGVPAKRQAWFVGVLSLSGMCTMAVVSFVERPYAKYDTTHKPPDVYCALPLTYQLVIVTITGLLLIVILLFAFKLRKLRLYMSDDAFVDGPQEGEILYRLAIALLVLFTSFIPTYLLTLSAVKVYVLALALLLYYDAILYFIFLPRSIRILQTLFCKSDSSLICFLTKGAEWQPRRKSSSNDEPTSINPYLRQPRSRLDASRRRSSANASVTSYIAYGTAQKSSASSSDDGRPVTTLSPTAEAPVPPLADHSPPSSNSVFESAHISEGSQYVLADVPPAEPQIQLNHVANTCKLLSIELPVPLSTWVETSV